MQSAVEDGISMLDIAVASATIEPRSGGSYAPRCDMTRERLRALMSEAPLIAIVLALLAVEVACVAWLR